LGSFKVIENGAVHWSAIVTIALCCTVFELFDVEIISHYTYLCYTVIISWPWNLAWRSLKVIETGAIRKLECGFLFVFYSNYGRICSRLW